MQGFRRVLARHPRHVHVIGQLEEAQQQLLDLDAAAKGAVHDGHWQEAVEASEGMNVLQPSDDVSERLGEARLSSESMSCKTTSAHSRRPAPGPLCWPLTPNLTGWILTRAGH
jgi:hypothetical protein